MVENTPKMSCICQALQVKRSWEIILSNQHSKRMGTNVELAILGALAYLDILVINATSNDHQLWRVDTIYAHNIVLTISLCDPTLNVQRLGVVLHRLHTYMLCHFNPFYYSSSYYNSLHSLRAFEKLIGMFLN